MIWNILSAVASLLAAVILLIGSIAAVLQLRHLRLSNQLAVYLHLMKELQSSEMIEARHYIESQDFSKPDVAKAALAEGMDPRVRTIGTYFQACARLVNLGLLDEDLLAPLIIIAPSVWKSLAPIAKQLRAQTGLMLWGDIEYLVYRYAKQQSTIRIRPWNADFVERTHFKGFPERFASLAAEALTPQPLESGAS